MMGVESRKGVDLINGRSLSLLSSSHRPLIVAAVVDRTVSCS